MKWLAPSPRKAHWGNAANASFIMKRYETTKTGIATIDAAKNTGRSARAALSEKLFIRQS